MDYNHTEQPNMNFQQPPFNPYRKKAEPDGESLSDSRRSDAPFGYQHLFHLYGSASWLYEYPVRPSVQR